MLQLLDVSIGVALLYSALALFVTTVQKLIASVFAARAKRLYDVLAEMLTGTVSSDGDTSKPLVQALCGHPLLQNLARGRPMPERWSNGLSARGAGEAEVLRTTRRKLRKVKLRPLNPWHAQATPWRSGTPQFVVASG